MPDHSTVGMPRWEDVPVAQQLSALAASCAPGHKREVLEHLLSHSHLPAQLWSASRLAALIEIRGSEALPLLFGWLESFDPTSLGWIAELVQLAPALPILIAAPVAGRTNLDTFASEGDRSGVLLHEGLIVVAQEVASPSPAVEDKRKTSEDRSRALVEAERPDAVDLHTLALVEAKSGGQLPTGRYGSAAEAFLAQMLDAHPLTAGLFEPQGEPGFAMQGGQSARVDFLAANLRIAIEVDGPHHFEAIQYRRDRHKDLELQSRGYLVLRFLAEDVAADFERVRATINRTVLARARDEADFGV
jgi:very-short-patch-repair endonuclease